MVKSLLRVKAERKSDGDNKDKKSNTHKGCPSSTYQVFTVYSRVLIVDKSICSIGGIRCLFDVECDRKQP